MHTVCRAVPGSRCSCCEAQHTAHTVSLATHRPVNGADLVSLSVPDSCSRSSGICPTTPSVQGHRALSPAATCAQRGGARAHRPGTPRATRGPWCQTASPGCCGPPRRRRRPASRRRRARRSRARCGWQPAAAAAGCARRCRPAVHQHLRGIRLADYGRVRAAERGRLSRALAGGAHGRAVCMRPHAAGPRAGPDCLHTVSRSRARQRPHGHPPQHRAGQAMNSLRAPPQPAPHRGHVVYGAAKGQLAVLLHRFHGHERAVHDEAAPAQSTLPL